MKKQSQLTNEIKKLQYQLSYSQHINKQMAHYLAELYRRTGIPPDKIPNLTNTDTNNVQILSGNNIQTHLQELYYVQPLIMCYEQNLYFLKEELTDLRQHNDQIVEQVQNVTKQNQFLRKELNLKLSMLAKHDNLGVDVGFMKIEKENLNEIRNVLEQKIEVLTKRVKQLEKELDSTNRQKLQLLTKSDLNNMKDIHEGQLKNIQVKIIGLQSQNKRLKNQLDNQKALLHEQTQKRQTLEQNIALLKNQLKLSKQNLEKYVSTKEKVSENLQSEMELVKDQLKASTKKQHQLFNKVMGLESEVQDKTNKINNLTIQNTQLQSNNNSMLQMLESYETKVSALNTKIKKLESESKSQNQQQSELIKKAQILQWKLSEKDEELTRKQVEWRKQKDRIGKVWEQRMSAVRKEMIPERE